MPRPKTDRSRFPYVTTFALAGVDLGDPSRVLTAREVEDRVCATFGAPVHEHSALPQEVT